MARKIDRDARHEHILKAANQCIRKYGFAGVTMRAVAKEAGFTTGALVGYVKSMDMLLIEAAGYGARSIRTKMLRLEAHPDPLVSLRGVLYLALPSNAQKRNNWSFWLGLWQRSDQSPELQAITRQRYLVWLKRITRLIERAQAAGDIDQDVDVHISARACVALLDGMAIQVLRSGSKFSSLIQYEMIDNWIASGLRPTRPIPRA